ncbi:hypothetical protein PACTADRAFT_19771, partial [Pachysolen tannophilus NRRL Y-2460]
VKSIKAFLDNTLPLDYFKQDLISILQKLGISKWHRLNVNQKTINEIKIERISGALTNVIYKVTYKKYHPLLLRIYGANIDSIIDRESELKILAKLSKKNIGPKLLGCFTNGRFEQFLNNSITLNHLQIREPKISRIIARRMKELHTGIILDVEEKSMGPMCWNLIFKWIDIIEKIFKEKNYSIKQQKDLLIVDFETYKQQVLNLKKFLNKNYNNGLYFNELVFCHNDTQYGNLLFYNPKNEEEYQDNNENSDVEEEDLIDEIVSGTNSTKFDKKLVVIDFEYSGSNIPAYDITNHFCEWMANYHDPEKSYYLDEKMYPSKEERLNFIGSYIQYHAFINNNNNNNNNLNKDMDDIKKLYNECILWRPVNSVYWALWGIVKKIEEEEFTKFNINIDKIGGINGERYVIKNLGEEEEVNEEEEAEIEENNQVSDDDFDYFKYALNKNGIFIGDLIQLNLTEKDIIDKDRLKDVKFMDCEFL